MGREEALLNWSDYLRERLAAEMETPTLPTGLAAFQFCLEERETLTSGGLYHVEQSGTLTLIWQDGSISRHRIAPPAADAEPLPFRQWLKVRCFQRHHRYLAKPPAALPAVPVCDPRVDAWFDTDEAAPCELPNFTLTRHTRTVEHSRGLMLRTQMTEVLAAASDRSPFTYRSRKFPDATELEYLRTEADWFQAMALTPIPRPLPIVRSAKLLLSPEAFRQALQNGFMIHLQNGAVRKTALAFAAEMEQRCTLSLRHDPLVPWSLGSCPFSTRGQAAASVRLWRNAAALPPDADTAALHWGEAAVPFYEWLREQPEVIYVPEWRFGSDLPPLSPQPAWVPRAYLFRRGRAVDCGSLFLPGLLAPLLTSPTVEQVRRIGWDGFGLAVPLAHLLPE
jgi:hypothetical protein